MFLGQKIGNSQSDGIAANHSRELRVQLGFEQSAVRVVARSASSFDEVRGDERNAADDSVAKRAFYAAAGFPASQSASRCVR